ncbi:MAG: TonB family protein [Pyrinomonadaceae bacterium]
MLDQLVESRDHGRESTRKAGILAVIMFIMVGAVLGGILWDLGKLFKNYLAEGMGGDLELTALVAPVPVAAEEPPPPEIKPEKTKVEQNVDTRKVLIQNIMESPKEVPKISNEKPPIPPRRLNVETIQSDSNSDTNRPKEDSTERTIVKTEGIGETNNTKPPVEDTDEPKLVEKATPTPKPVPKTVSGGVVNSKATNLVKPAYPQAARAVRASGAVNVQVTISENGSVISASAVSGHPLLRQAAEQAARSSKFSPTLLSGQAVKVTGVIVYNFVP